MSTKASKCIYKDINENKDDRPQSRKVQKGRLTVIKESTKKTIDRNQGKYKKDN